MKYFVFGPVYFIRLDPGEKIIESLKALCETDKIGAGILHGLGATSQAELGWFDREAREYRTLRVEEPCEIVSLYGNVSVLDGKPFLHCHIALGDKTFGIRGGHLREAVVSATCEITLTRFFDKVRRKRDDKTGLSLLQLDPEED
jgi:predicted DNA-binding protein with PD1-like motif